MYRIALGVVLLIAAACTAVAEPAALPGDRDDDRVSGIAHATSDKSIAPRASLPGSQLRGAATDRFARGAQLTVLDLGAALNVRMRPGVGAPRVATLRAGQQATATGRARAFPDEVWVEVELDDGEHAGWADARYMGAPGATEDAAAEIPASDEPLVGTTVRDLGERVVERLGYGSGSAAVLSGAPLILDRAEVAFDVPRSDDTTLGVRLRVLGTPVDSANGRFQLERVERTPICTHDPGPSGRCR